MATTPKKTYVKDINESNMTEWQRAMFSGLTPDVIEKAKVEFTTDRYGNLKKPAGVKTVTKTVGLTGSDSEDTKLVTSYQKDLGTVNGLHLVATYDDKGSLTGFDEWRKSDSAAPVSRVYTGDKQYLYPKWDATGKAVQAKGYETKNGGLFSDFFSDVTSGFDDLVLQNPAIRAAAIAYAAPIAASELGFAPAAGTTAGEAAIAGGAGGGEGLLTGYDAAFADLASATPAFTGAEAGLLSSAAGAAVPELTAQQTAEMIAAEQAGSMTAGDTLAAIQAEQAAAGAPMIGGTGAAAAGAGALGAGAAGAGATGLTLSDAALLKGGLSLAGGLLQGETATDATNTLATAQEKLAKEASAMGKFQPVGVTTRFGTSSFVTDPKTGAITPSYTLSPEAQAYQDQLAGIASSGLEAGKGMMSLGQQYVGESPEAVRQRYITTQQALLTPQQEQSLAAIRANQANTGRSGLAFGATASGMAATNPEMAAYYNALAQSQNQLAANAETQYQNQVNFGTGLMGQATTPFSNAFTAQKSVETAGQQPLQMATDFAKTVSDAGARQGANYAAGMAPSLQSSYKANVNDPMATFLTGLSDSDLALWGLSKVK